MTRNKKYHAPASLPNESEFYIPRHCYYSAYAVAVCCFIAVYLGRWYENKYFYTYRINLPSTVERTNKILNISEPEWGTFRANNFLGLKDTSRDPLLFGIMWFSQISNPHEEFNLRHWSANYDRLKNFGWTVHDGRSCGVQQINETDFTIETTFIKAGDSVFDSKVRIHFKPRTFFRGGISVITYLYHDAAGGELSFTPQRAGIPKITGHTSALGSFTVQTEANCADCENAARSIYGIDDPVRIEESIMGNFVWAQRPSNPSLHYVSLDSREQHRGWTSPTLIATQTTTFTNNGFYIDVVFKSDKSPTYNFDSLLTRCLLSFEEKFTAKFSVKSHNLSEDQIAFSKYAVSSLVGGISHFRGRSVVGKKGSPDNTTYFDADLITAVPSRAFFPRGFLWDEGFHGILLARWDSRRLMEIISHWFDLMNTDGWIPREQILGTESARRVPHQFIRQQLNDGNPPTFFLAIESLIGQNDDLETTRLFLKNLFPRLIKWLSWYMTTQAGLSENTFRWHGRVIEEGAKKLLNPLTLMSGLDDFPRASNPTDFERHVDLYCWVASSARIMANIAEILGEVDQSLHYKQIFDTLSNMSLLNTMHWSTERSRYADFGLDGSSGELPNYRFVDQNFGYINIFPFLLTILSPNSVELNQVLKDVKDLLLTPFGLRSLSVDSPFYRKSNSHDDPPYWRGDVWINMNYLCLRALQFYILRMDGSNPAQQLAKEIYQRLRDGVVDNVYKEFKRTGFIWERYDDMTGHGKGVHPFTGWSTLIVLIMTEDYH